MGFILNFPIYSLITICRAIQQYDYYCRVKIPILPKGATLTEKKMKQPIF